MFRSKLLPGALLLPLCLTAVRAAHAQPNLLTNGSFELPSLTALDTCDGGTPWCLKGTGNAPGWSVAGNGVTVIHNNYLNGVNPPVLVQASHGVQYLDLNQAGGANGSIYQFIQGTVGQRYRLSMDFSAWAVNAVGASVEYSLSDPRSGFLLETGSFTASVGGVWTTRTLEMTAISDLIGVSIRSTFAPQAAIAVDNVRLSAVTTVPEPQTVGMMLVGLVAMVVVRRRRER
ncbi:MAG: PEP-CTERM sorting domain-containing protein [Gemmatimonadaceae bacterium]|nr:PEP-CTERM sorting domain-containing protein [Gemmatimonadaceae bacterium]